MNSTFENMSRSVTNLIRYGVVILAIFTTALISNFEILASPSSQPTSAPTSQPAEEPVKETWRTDPRLKGRFPPDFPDDLQVIVHDGGPRVTTHVPELVWVRITSSSGDVFTATILNKPEQLTSVKLDSVIQFIVPEGGDYPLMVSPQYLAERSKWVIEPCNKCGLTELFDPPSTLIKIVFPDLPPDQKMEAFTAFCGACGGVQVVRDKDFEE